MRTEHVNGMEPHRSSKEQTLYPPSQQQQQLESPRRYHIHRRPSKWRKFRHWLSTFLLITFTITLTFNLLLDFCYPRTLDISTVRQWSSNLNNINHNNLSHFLPSVFNTTLLLGLPPAMTFANVSYIYYTPVESLALVSYNNPTISSIPILHPRSAARTAHFEIPKYKMPIKTKLVPSANIVFDDDNNSDDQINSLDGSAYTMHCDNSNNAVLVYMDGPLFLHDYLTALRISFVTADVHHVISAISLHSLHTLWYVTRVFKTLPKLSFSNLFFEPLRQIAKTARLRRHQQRRKSILI